MLAPVDTGTSRSDGIGRAITSKDFLAGTLYIAFGLLGLWLGRDLETGTASAMESGYFPRLVCILLIALGVVLAGTALLRPGDAPERGKWRPFVFVTLSSLAFALLLRPLGLVLTLAISTVLARFAGGQMRLLALLMLCLILIVANVGIFVIALKIQIPLWPTAF
jgi:putative tricarboxylic transport membrane protein